MKEVRSKIQVLPSGSHSIALAPFSPINLPLHKFVVVGTETLTGNFNISPTVPVNIYTSIDILWNADVTPSGHHVVIFGVTIPDDLLASRNFRVKCFYDGVTGVATSPNTNGWVVTLIPDASYSESIDASRIASNAITTAKITDLNVTTAKIADLNVTTAKINDLGVTTGKLAANAVTTAKITDLNVTTGKINDLAVTTGKIDDLGVTTAKIADANVTTAKIADANVTTAKMADGNVTNAKLEDNANRYTRDIRISFLTSGEIGVLNFIMGEDCEIEQVSGTVMQPFATDAGTVIFKNNAGTVMTGSQIDFGTGLVLGNQVTNTVTGNNSFTRGQKVTLELSKTTAGSGIANISLLIKKV